MSKQKSGRKSDSNSPRGGRGDQVQSAARAIWREALGGAKILDGNCTVQNRFLSPEHRGTLRAAGPEVVEVLNRSFVSDGYVARLESGSVKFAATQAVR